MSLEGDFMKVVIQIPSYNEEDCLSKAIGDLPRELSGVSEVIWLIIDDGSRDDTVQVAIEHGVDYVISHTRNLGLARAFQSGLEAALFLGADIIVNTDADNQYNAQDIQKLIDPILKHEADFVIGARPIKEIEHFSPLKKWLQKVGSKFVSRLSRLDIKDTTSGFRAMNRKTALQLHVFNDYTYTLETLIQSGQLKLATIFVPIRVNEKTRDSRLISNTYNYLKKSSSIIFRSFLTYNPLRFFLVSGSISFLTALILGIRYLFFFFAGEGTGHIQSLLLAIILFILGTSAYMFGMQAELISVNRRLIENATHQVRRLASHPLFVHEEPYPGLRDAYWAYIRKESNDAE